MTAPTDDTRGEFLSADAARERAERFPYPAARRELLKWFDVAARCFPWRDEPSPYRVWVSEIMLQQTTTQTALGYFERFIARFPDPQTLAAAREEEVLALWEGLGYYRRARYLHAAAKTMLERFNAAVPNDFDAVLSLPGVGRYCAGAIMSFGFDRRAPILEANTTRLHARLLALADPKSTASQDVLWGAADKWLPRETTRRAPGVFRRLNGALTDLGSVVCQPENPKCSECPLTKFCHTFQHDLQREIPAPKRKQETVKRTDVAFWITRSDLKSSTVFDACREPAPTDVLLLRQPPWALWAGLWDFPRLEVVDPLYRDADAWRRDPELADRLALFLETEAGAPPDEYRPGPTLKTFRHSVTRYRVSLSLCRLQTASLELPEEGRSLFDVIHEPSAVSEPSRLAPSDATLRLKGKPLAQEWRWVAVSSLGEYPLSSPGRKIANYIRNAVKDDAVADLSSPDV